MNKDYYDMAVRTLKKECISKGSSLDDALYRMSCDNNARWRENQSKYLTKVTASKINKTIEKLKAGPR